MKKLLLIVGLIAVAALIVKKRGAGRSDWHGLTEEEARQRLNDRFPNRVPEEKRDAVTDKIVSKMRDKGVIVDLTDTVDLTEVDQSVADAGPAGDQSVAEEV